MENASQMGVKKKKKKEPITVIVMVRHTRMGRQSEEHSGSRTSDTPRRNKYRGH